MIMAGAFLFMTTTYMSPDTQIVLVLEAMMFYC